ncbi:MAG: hypothetical protein EA397_19920 [Deltaproteobacteria bacterium]|nr:MAG: hypothetical protein EA397_19920 [Deltaproteobacteria bacterium]
MRSSFLIGIFLLCACEQEEPLAMDEGHPLADLSYRFCHEPSAFRKSDRTYCALLDDDGRSLCPGLAEACESSAPPVEERRAQGCGESPVDRSVEARRPDPSQAPSNAESASSLDFLGAILRWTIAILLALALLGVLAGLARLVSRWLPGRPRSRPAASPSPRVEVNPFPGPLDVRSLPTDTLLDQAHRALEQGDQEGAVLLAREAALRGLSTEGLLVLRPSRTDRELLSDLANDRTRYGLLHEIVSAVEGLRWGRVPTDPQTARRIVETAARLVGVAVLLFVLLPTQARGSERDIDGLAVLMEQFGAEGARARVRIRPLSSLDEQVQLLVVDAERAWLSAEQWDQVSAWVHEGGGLVLLGGPGDALPALGAPRSPVRERTDSLRFVAQPVWPDQPQEAWVGGEGTVLLSAEVGPPDEPEPAAIVVELSHGAGTIWGISDPTILRNGGLLRSENLSFSRGLIGYVLQTLPPSQRGTFRVEFVVSGVSSEAGAPTPVAGLSNARLLPLVLQVLLWVALLVWWRGHPFAPPAPEPDVERREVADHARALGARLRSLGASRYAASAQAAWFLRRFGRVGLKEAARRSGMDEGRAETFANAVQRLAREPEGSENDVHLMERTCEIMNRPSP